LGVWTLDGLHDICASGLRATPVAKVRLKQKAGAWKVTDIGGRAALIIRSPSTTRSSQAVLARAHRSASTQLLSAIRRTPRKSAWLSLSTRCAQGRARATLVPARLLFYAVQGLRLWSEPVGGNTLRGCRDSYVLTPSPRLKSPRVASAMVPARWQPSDTSPGVDVRFDVTRGSQRP
jgi:hypothetical protein